MLAVAVRENVWEPLKLGLISGYFVRLLQLQPKVAENPSFEQEEFLCACHSEKQSFGFLKKDPRDQVLFNLSGLSRAATGTRRWTSFLNLCQWISARWRSWGYGLSSKDETRQTCILSTYASLRHFWAFSSTRKISILKRRIKSVSPGKKINK